MFFSDFPNIIEYLISLKKFTVGTFGMKEFQRDSKIMATSMALTTLSFGYAGQSPWDLYPSVTAIAPDPDHSTAVLRGLLRSLR